VECGGNEEVERLFQGYSTVKPSKQEKVPAGSQNKSGVAPRWNDAGSEQIRAKSG
jgi:hypothetical protein